MGVGGWGVGFQRGKTGEWIPRRVAGSLQTCGADIREISPMSNQLQRRLKRLIKITHGCTDTRFFMFCFFFLLFIHVFFFLAHEELSIRRRVADCVAAEISPSRGTGGG